jgi:hypothetical protein
MFLPWKCGSTTCEKRFAKLNQSPYPTGCYYSEILNKNTNKHIILSDFQKLPEFNLDYYKISWARNPYDRLYSGFLQRQLRVMIQKDQLNADDASYVQKGWDCWLEQYISQFLGTDKIFGGYGFQYTHLSDQQYVDFIGRVETMNSDTKKICKHFGLNVNLNQTANVKTKFEEVDPFDMKISDYKYIDKYTDEQIKIVNQVYAKDFELLKYDKFYNQT